MAERFSQRHGHASADSEITVRDDAPSELRTVLVAIAYEIGLRPTELRAIACRVLRITPDPDNWSDYPNVDMEVRDALMYCDWFHVYDVIEEIFKVMVGSKLPDSQDSSPEYFSREVNSYFQQRGIGWQLSDGLIQVRGPVHFEAAVHGAVDSLEHVELRTAQGELREAMKDLSRRPVADLTGAIQHAMAALECVARDLTGESGATLGKIVKDHPDLLPKPLDQAVEKAWGYASDKGRHLREGLLPTYAEAELVVSISGAVCLFLTHKIEQSRK